MRRFAKVVVVAAAVAGLVSCGPRDADQPTSSDTASPTAGSTSKSEASSAPTPEPKSDGRMVLLDRLSIPKMEGWKYLVPEEGEADRTRENDFFLDVQDCVGAALEMGQCPKVIVSDTGAALKLAKETGYGELYKGMTRDQVAGAVLCRKSDAPITAENTKPLKPQGIDEIDGVPAYRYHAKLAECGVNVKSMPGMDPSYNGGTTMWIIQTDKVYLTITTFDSGAKGMVAYVDIDKLRYALTHGKWIG